LTIQYLLGTELDAGSTFIKQERIVQSASFPGRHRYQHRHSATIIPVPVAVESNQISLFELNGDKDIGSGHYREEQMAESHVRRAPESHEETKVEWMPNRLV